MKSNKFKIKHLLSLALLLTSLSVLAISPADNKTDATTENTIRHYFKFPQVLFASENLPGASNKVEVLFSTDNNGIVNFALAKTNNAQLKKEIEMQFLKLKLKDIKPLVINSVTLNFKTL